MDRRVESEAMTADPRFGHRGGFAAQAKGSRRAASFSNGASVMVFVEIVSGRSLLALTREGAAVLNVYVDRKRQSGVCGFGKRRTRFSPAIRSS